MALLVQLVVGIGARGRQLAIQRVAPATVAVGVFVRRIDGRVLHAECRLELANDARVLEDLRQAGNADDEEATGHLGRGPEHQGTQGEQGISGLSICQGRS